MKKYITNFAITMACFVTLLAPTSAFAFCDGCVTGAVNLLDASVQAMNATISQLLYNIGIAINENGNKVSHTIEAASRSEREFGVVQEKNRRYEDARQ
ncbi:MAG: conjugal transfer protein TraW, partial [Nitrosomonadales bacterium]|nr:conjugal transfer protein TraW [Nitrosomonadales bacterium]